MQVDYRILNCERKMKKKKSLCAHLVGVSKELSLYVCVCVGGVKLGVSECGKCRVSCRH